MRRIFIRSILPVALIPLMLLLYIGVLQFSGNFHEVIAGQLYRSSQLSDKQLWQYVQANGIKTIINLRGENDGSSWYQRERAVSEKLGVQHVDFGMSAYKELTPARVAQLIQIMREAPKPILIHCKSGADRTGLASAIYVNRIAGMDEDTAERQLSIRFGHLGIPFLSSAYAMDRSWEKIENEHPVTSMIHMPDEMI